MRIVTATYVNEFAEPGWPIMDPDVPLGKKYTVDLDNVQPMILQNLKTGRKLNVDCIATFEENRYTGYIPLIAFKIEEDT